ncbi:hypothetical protein L195_g047390 [Trifolium pratense]|uniref:Uncharacterized protein n=1 Tax=Trifolium pratense TaxID=57577 RepID=A0A2K3MKG8_TRIPR|nr:hypothetical protein L195_g028682 [Trifolium pratense]PNX90584.1 hypothetical protein L195_g046709 [Trifolium pratense]PNX91260.1 hypothetical protein L195_g047390 [Trifolium pratense]
MKQIRILIFLTILLTVTTSVSSRRSTSSTKSSPSADNKNNDGGGVGGGGNDYGGSFGFGPGGGFSIPGFDNNIGGFGGGYGGGFGGPNGGHSTNGVIRPTVVCKDRGPCFQKKVTCPARCFTSYSRSGKGYGGGGGGGGCTIDCKKKCTAYC